MRPAHVLLAGILGVALTGCVGFGMPGDTPPMTGLGTMLAPVHLQPAWRRVLREGEVYREKPHELAAAASDGRWVAVGSRGGWFVLLDAAGGDLRWRVRVPGGMSGAPIFDGPRVVAGTDDGDLVAWNVQDGSEAWRYTVGGAIGRAPLLVGDLLYFVDGTNAVYALDRRTGEWRWQYRRDPPAEFALLGEARPVVADGKLYVGFSDGHIVCLDAADGALLWTRDLAPEHERFQDVDGDAVVLDDTVYAASAAGGLYALDTRTGEPRWTAPLSGVVGLVEHDRDLIASTNRGTVLRLRARDGSPRWRTRFPSGAPSAAVRTGAYLGVGVSKDGLYFLDPVDGRPVQRFLPGQGINAMPAAYDDALYVLSNGGVLYAFR